MKRSIIAVMMSAFLIAAVSACTGDGTAAAPSDTAKPAQVTADSAQESSESVQAENAKNEESVDEAKAEASDEASVIGADRKEDETSSAEGTSDDISDMDNFAIDTDQSTDDSNGCIGDDGLVW